MTSLIFLSSLLTLALSQTTQTTISYPNYGSPRSTIYGSIISANPEATTVAIACSSSGCGLFEQTLVYGTSTWHMDSSLDPSQFTGTRDCTTVSKGGDAVCTDYVSFPGLGDTSTFTYPGSQLQSMEVIVTEGAEKLGPTPAKTTEGGSIGAAVASAVPLGGGIVGAAALCLGGLLM